MGEALIVRRGGSGSTDASNYKLKTQIFTTDGTFTVPKALGQKFTVRIFGGGGGAANQIGGGGGGMMNNNSLILNEGENIPVIIGKGGKAVLNTSNNSSEWSIANNGAKYSGNGGNTSFGNYLIARGGFGVKIGILSNNKYYYQGGNGGAGGASTLYLSGSAVDARGGDGYQFGGGAGTSYGGGFGGKWGGGGGVAENYGGSPGGVIYNLETLNYSTHYENRKLVINNSGFGGNGGSNNINAENGINTVELSKSEDIDEACIGFGISYGICGGGGGYGGNGGNSTITNYNSQQGAAGGGGGYGANGGDASDRCCGGGGGYGAGGYGGGVSIINNYTLNRYVQIAGGGGSYGHGGTIYEQPTFGGGGSTGLSGGIYSYFTQNGADGICIIQYYAE